MATLADSGTVRLAAGANVSTALGLADFNTFIEQAEGELATDTGIDFVDKFATLPSTMSGSATAAVASKAGIKAINFDMSGYTSRAEALTMINVNWATYDRLVQDLTNERAKSLLGVQ